MGTEPLEQYIATVDKHWRQWVVALSPRGGDVDAAAVASYVREALDDRDHYLANATEITADARARARTR